MKLILSDNSIITFDHDMGIGDIVAYYDSMTQAQVEEAWITPENVKHIRITTDEDAPVGEYYNLVIISTELTPVYVAEDDSETIAGYELHIHLRAKTAVEILADRVEALEESQNVQDGAIDDLGGAVSELMEG